MFDPTRQKSDLELIELIYRIEEKVTSSGKRIKTITFSKPIILSDDEFGLESTVISSDYLEERLKLISDGYKGE